MFKMDLQGRYVLLSLIVTVSALVFITLLNLKLVNDLSDNLFNELTERSELNHIEQTEKQVKQISDYLAISLFDPIYRFNPEKALHLIKPFFEIEQIKTITVFDKEGKIFHDGSSVLLSFGKPFNHEVILKTVLQDHQPYQSTSEYWYRYATPIHVGDVYVGGVYIEYSLGQMQKDLSQMASTIKDIGRQGFTHMIIQGGIVAGIVLTFVVILTVIAARALTQPIRQLIHYAQTIGGSQFNGVAKSAIVRNDEIGELARAFADMSKRLVSKTEHITFMAYHDELTGLPNRTQFIRHVNRWIEFESERSFTILFIDLDEFKTVNDSYGHTKGNELLKQIAKRLNDCVVQEKDRHSWSVLDNRNMVARVGGDEFLAYLTDTGTQTQQVELINRIIESVQQPLSIEDENLFIASSIGVAQYPTCGRGAEELIQHADIAMYYAKKDGKNTYRHYSQEMNEKLTQRAFIEKELRLALNNLEQFEFWYQPIVDLEQKRLIGAEALVRWKHAEIGLVPPDQFIPIAEHTGLIIPIGEWLIEKVCKDLKQHQHLVSDDFHISFNLSAKQIYRQDIASVISKNLEKYGLNGNRLYAEITETLLMKDENKAITTINALQKLNLNVWLDDFGTGYSSLAYIRRFNIDGIKIDRSFIDQLSNDSKSEQLVKAIISMAESLELPVVAEGIEYNSQLTFLALQGCTFGQGYLFSKPLPVDEFFTQLNELENLVHIELA